MPKQRIQLSDHFTYSRLLRFVLPCIGTMLFTSIYGIVDGLCVSNFVGKTAFAAINLIMPLPQMLGTIGFMLGTGGSAIVALRRMVPPRFGKDIGRRRAKSARRLRFAHVAPPCDKSAARYDRRVWRHPECGVTAHIGRSGLLFEPISIRRQFERPTKHGHRIVHLRINARKRHFQGAVACLVELRRRVNDELPFRRFRSILDMCASSLAETDFPHVHRMRHCTCGQHGHAAHIHCRSTLHHVQSFPLFPT